MGAADAATRGRGVFAKVDFKKGERVLSIPYSACVGTAGLRTGAGRASRPPFAGATPAECLAWNLLSIRGDSEWAPYVAALPTGIDSPTSGAWNRKEIAELQIGDAVAAAAIALAKDAKAARTIAEASEGGGAATSAGAGGVGVGDHETFAKDWAWALSCVRSRAIELEGRQSLLVPFVDMLNHVHEAPHVAWSSAAPATGDESGDGDGDGGGGGSGRGASGCVVLTAERQGAVSIHTTTFTRLNSSVLSRSPPV